MRAFGEATYDETAMADPHRRGNKDDERLFVQFSLHPQIDQDASAKEGRPIYKDVEYVMIMVPGDKESIVHRPVWRRDLERFPKQYEAFKAKKDQMVIGTPLGSVSFLTRPQIKELEFFNVYTVEQLASIADAHAGKFMGLQRLKQLANDFLTLAKETAPLTAIRAEIEKKDGELAAANQAIEDQGARIKALEAQINLLVEKAKK